MTDLEMAGRALVERELVPLTPIVEIRARAAGVVSRRRARRRAAVALVLAVLVLAGALARGALAPDRHQRVATIPSTRVSPTAPVPAPTTAVGSLGTGVSAARLTRADLGMAATYDPLTGRSKLWLTRDSRTWQDVTPSRGISWTVEDVFALDDLHLWATSFDCAGATVTAWRSNDGGRTWITAPAGSHACSAGSTAQVQFVDAFHGWIVLSSANGPVARLEATTDGGATWSTLDTRLPDLGDVSFHTPHDGYLGSDPSIPFVSDLYVTHDAGRTWRQVTLPLDDRSWPNPSWSVIYGVPTFVDASDGVLPVTLANEGGADVEWWTTADAGGSWQLRTPPSIAGISAHGVEPTALLTSVTGAHVWWALTYFRGVTRVERTLDAGAQWSATDDAALSWRSPTWFGAANADVAWMLGRGLYATTDAGHTWYRFDPPT
jgi:hypothetical protein